MRPAPALLAVLAVASAACDVPRDPAGTLERVRGGTLRVGVLIDPPWTRLERGEPAGVEVELLARAARRLDASAELFVGGPDALLRALEERELDLVVGGLTDETRWKGRVALTRPYVETRVVVSGPSGAWLREGIDELPVACGAPLLAALVAREGGRPVAPGGAALRALPEWALRDPLAPRRPLDAPRRHVLAAPPGENAWTLWLDRFLAGERARVEERLREEAGP